jgi:hypothetical protein
MLVRIGLCIFVPNHNINTSKFFLFCSVQVCETSGHLSDRIRAGSGLWQRLSHAHHVHHVRRCAPGGPYVKYGVRYPVYLGSCIQLYSLAETPQQPTSPRIWAHTRGR